MQTNGNVTRLTNYTKSMIVATFILMLAIGGIGFWLSYEALKNVAQSYGKPGLLGLAWPLIIDLPIIAFSLAGIIAQTIGKSPYLPRAIVALMTAVTVAYNWFHAYDVTASTVDNVVTVSVAVAAPLMYLAAFEVSLWLIDAIMGRGTVTTPAPQSDKAQRQAALLSHLRVNPDATLTDAAQVVGVSRQTVGKYVNELTATGALHSNGNGWRVTR